MESRKYVITSYGLVACIVSPVMWNVENPAFRIRHYKFETIAMEKLKADIPIHRITPDDGHYNFTYYDNSAHSPSVGYVAVTKIPFLEDIHLASGSHIWGQAGGHPNWHPDGINIIRVLKPDGPNSPYRFCQHRYEGKNFQVLTDTKIGGDHPRITPDSRYISTDDFPMENGDQMLKLRLIDLQTDTDYSLLTMHTFLRQGLRNSTLRLDGHPTWDRLYKKLAFQAAPEGKRQVYIADLSSVLN